MASSGNARERVEARRLRAANTVRRPWEVYALTALWAIKGAEELFRGLLGTGFYIYAQASRGLLYGYALQIAIQSLLFSLVLTAGSFYVMAALWLGKRPARRWGIVFALLSQIAVIAYLVTRPPEFGGTVALVRTVVIASIVNLGIVAILLFDEKLAAFLGSTRLVGWWSARHR